MISETKHDNVEGLFSKLKHRVSKIATTSTLHGLSNLIRTESIVFKIIWFACLITSGSVCCVLINRTVLEYLRYEVTTKIRNIKENEVDFPAIAICNSNALVTEFAEDFLISYIENNTNYSFANVENRLESLSGFLSNNTELKQQISFSFYNLNIEIKKKFGLPVEELILKCEFNHIKCNLTNLKIAYHWNYGLCYVFNSDNIYKLTSDGIDSSLSLELFAGYQNHVPYFTKSIGFQIIIYNQTDSFKFSYYFQRVSIQTNTETHIAISQNFIEKLKNPYSECDYDENDYNPGCPLEQNIYKEYTLKNIIYKKKNCMLEAYRKEVYLQCNCINEIGDIPGVNTTCFTLIEAKCSSNLYRRFLQGEFYDMFMKICPIECNTQYYTFSNSFEFFPSPHYGEFLMEKLQGLHENKTERHCYRELEKSVAKVNIYYDKLGYQLITEIETMTNLDLVANIGGMLGLFMGMSLLSFIELFEMIIECFLVFKNKAFR